MKKGVTIKDLRQFGFVLAGILLLFGALHFFKGHVKVYLYFVIPGLTALAVTAIAPERMRKVYSVFIKVAHAIGWVNTRIILTLMFYLIITPIALVIKLLGKDLLDIKTSKDRKSYWKEREVTSPTKESLERQY